MSINVVGAIGAGKSELIKAVKKFVDKKRKNGNGTKEKDEIKTLLQIVLELVDEWKKDILPLFYSDRPKYAFEFQVRVFDDHVESVCDALKKSKTKEILVERSMHCAMIFWNLQKDIVDPRQYKLYVRMWEKWTRLIPVPDYYIFLETTDVDALLERIKTRGRAGEDGVFRAYQKALMKAHRELYTKERFGDKLIILNALDSIEINVEKIKHLFI